MASFGEEAADYSIGPTTRSMHGRGDDPQTFSHDQWVAAKNALFTSTDARERAMGAMMNKMQHYYFEAAAKMVMGEGRTFAEAACVKLLNLRGSLRDNGKLTLGTAISQVKSNGGALSNLARNKGPLSKLQELGNSTEHYNPVDRERRLLAGRRPAVEAAYEVANAFVTSSASMSPIHVIIVFVGMLLLFAQPCGSLFYFYILYCLQAYVKKFF